MNRKQSAVSAAIERARRARAANLAGFKDLLRFPSISQDPAYQPQLLACVDWLAAEMRGTGIENCRAIATAGNPVLYGDWLGAGDDKPTILIYAHYDVQPVGDASLWRTDPFEPTIVGDRLVARGALDDKCGIWVNLKAVESILAVSRRLPVNLKFIFEGEEELGSRNTGSFVQAHKALLAADALIICDGPFSPQQPVIGTAVRGAVMGEVRLKGPPHDLHSGRYGGAVKNPLHYAARIIASFHDDSGRVQIKGFYDDVIPLSERQARHLNQLWKTIGPGLQRAAGVDAFFGDRLGVFAERTTSQPTLDVNGIHGGYQGEGTRAIIPAEAGFKVTIRTVAGQDSGAMWGRFVEHVMSFAEPGIDIDAELLSSAHPFLLPDDGREIGAIQRALKAALGKEALLMRHGGSLPIGGILARELDVPVTMFGYGSGDNSHAPDEFIIIEDLQAAIEVAIHLLFALGGDS
ncbi:MAG: M20/M25/M40 family metallo-hydrolase [Chloroflexota bacterium]|nr:M20/M25/M40 family metallo-hydrolase [Chloroflexota bacterium]